MHAILFEKNEVSALPDLNKTLRGGIGEFAKDCLRARNRGTGILTCLGIFGPREA